MKKMTFREIRKAKGLSASYVAEKTGIKHSTLLSKELGYRKFNARETQLLCELYEVGIAEVKI